MIQNEIKQMLQKTSKDKIALYKLLTKGYVSYSKDSMYVGAIATINSKNKAIISYLQDINDESQVIATVHFENGCTLIYVILNDEYYLIQTGRNLLTINGLDTTKIYNPNKKGIKNDIDSIRSRCREASLSPIPLTKKLFDQTRFSKDKILTLLNDTLIQLNKAEKSIHYNKDIVSPHLSSDNTLEI